MTASLAAGIASPALAEAHVFDALYFVEGRINDSTPASPLGVNGRNVVFYRGYPQVIRVASARTFEDGRYTINIYDNSNIRIDPMADYYVAVEQGSDTYGANPVLVNLAQRGFSEVNLTLAAGEGPIPIMVDEGPVMLDIARAANTEGSELVITWSINTTEFPTLPPDQPIDVYMLTGDGSGQFVTGGTGWNKIIDNNALIASGFTIDVPTKTFRYQNQVGRDPKEVYFKGLVTGSAVDDLTYGLPGAAAAGKFNAVVEKPASGQTFRYSFVSVPFVVPDPSPDAVFGSQVPAASVQSNATELWGWTGSPEGFGERMYLTSGGWVTETGVNPVSVTVGRGYVFRTKPAATEDKTVTTVGKVLNVPFGPVNVGLDLYEFLGNPYPTKYGLKSAGFSVAAGVKGATTSGSSDQFWGWTGIDFGEQDFYNTTADDWQLISPASLLDGFGPTRTLVYRRSPAAPSGGFNWRMTP